MLKLIRYEFRKNRALLVTVLCVIAALEIYFLVSAYTTASYGNAISEAAQRAERSLIVAMSLLAFASFGTAVAIFVMGVSGYSRELNQKTSYLMFMTPRSSYAVVGANLLFTLLAGVAFALLLIGLAALDFPLMSKALGAEWTGYYNLLNAFMTQNDLSLTGALLTIVFYVGMVFLSIIATVSIAYLAITLSATFMRGKKGHALIAALLFLVLTWLNGRVTELIRTGIVSANGQIILDIENAADLMRLLVPQMIQDVVVLAISLVACGWMLDKRIDL